MLKILQQDEAIIARELGVGIAKNWSVFGIEIFDFVSKKMENAPKEVYWWTYLPVLKQDRILIGTGGYKGPPNDDGMVEIGYEIAPAYRGKGLATEMAKTLVTNAFTFPEIMMVQAHTLAEENASCSILKNCGFSKTAELEDEEDGKIWQWQLSK